jgi:hypothetical protein
MPIIHRCSLLPLLLCLPGTASYANIRALRCLHMTSLNRPRLDILLEHFWSKVGLGEVAPPCPRDRSEVRASFAQDRGGGASLPGMAAGSPL